MIARRGPLSVAVRLRADVGPLRRALAAVLAVLAVAIGPVLALQDRLLLDACAPVAHLGPFGVLGTRLAILQPDADCPAGTLGVGPTGHSAVVLISVGLPVLLAHLALVVAGWSLSSVLARVARGVVTVLRAVLRPRPTGSAAAPVAARRLSVVGRVAPPRGRRATGVRLVRGPPVAA